MKQQKPATVTEVAARAGVSVSTAARVLRGSTERVDPELVRRVQEAGEELGYVRNILAQSLRRGSPTTIGLVVGDMLDPYYGEIAEVITQRAEAEYGMSVMVCNMQRDPLLEIKYCRHLCEHRVAGLILAGGGFDQWSHVDRLVSLFATAAAAGIVAVTLTPRGLDAPAFCIDNEELGRQMAGKLAERGHGRVGVLLSPPESEVTQQRLRGATRTLAAAGIGFRVIHSGYTPALGAAAVKQLLADDPDVTAVMVGSDAMAIGALSGLAEMGLSVPEDFSVVSAGNTPLARWSAQPLSTFDLALRQCSIAALDHVARGVKGEGDATVPSFPLTYIEGSTLGHPPSAAAV